MLAEEPLGILMDESEEVADKKSFCLDCCPHDPTLEKQKKMDEYVFGTSPIVLISSTDQHDVNQHTFRIWAIMG